MEYNQLLTIYNFCQGSLYLLSQINVKSLNIMKCFNIAHTSKLSVILLVFGKTVEGRRRRLYKGEF